MPITTFTHSSPLGWWTHSEYRPTRLAGIVERMWHFEGLTTLPRERSFAKAHTEIILQLGPRFHNVLDNGARGELFPALCVGGATTSPTVIEAPQTSCRVLGIRLHALAAYRLFNMPASLLVNCTINLSDAVQGNVQQLSDECSSKQTTRERFQAACAWIERRLLVASSAHDGVAWAAQQLTHSHGTHNIADLQQQSSLTRARFISMFREQVGLSPKQYARILRFEHLLDALRSGVRLSTAALNSGYYDQAHMHRDFAEFARLTPAAFVAATRFPNSASMPESS